MDLTTIPAYIWIDWIRSQTTLDKTDLTGLTLLAQMSDTDKISSLTTFLQDRIASNATASSSLSASIQSQIDALAADTLVCNGLLGL